MGRTLIGNIKGPQGERGLQGEQGERGLQGIQGEQGPRGLQGLPGEMTATSVAPVFSPAAAYSKGDYVTYGGQLYRFTADHAASDWIGTDATAVAIVDEFKSTFVAEYGVTTFNEVDEQVQLGNFVVVAVLSLTGNYYATLNGSSFGERGFGSYTAYEFNVPPELVAEKIYFTEYEISSDEGWATHNTQIDAVNAGIVSQFTYTKAYNVGDYVIHNGVVYKFTTPHTAGNYWSNSEVTQAVLADDLSDLKSAVNDYFENIVGNGIIPFTNGYYIKTNDTPVNPSAPVALAGCEYAVVDCQAGDKFTITACGSGSVAHCYCFLDSSNNNILSELYSTANVGVRGLVIEAPTNAVKLCINSKTTFDTLCYKNSPADYSIEDISNILGYERVGEFGLVDSKYIKVNGSIASASTFAYTKPIYIAKGKHIVYTATGGPSAASIAKTSDAGTTFTACAGFTQNGVEEKIEYTTEEDSYYSFVFLKAQRHYAYVSTINLNSKINTGGKNIAFISAILRNTGDGWDILDDSDHDPVNVSSVEVTSGGSLKLNYSITAKKVLSLVIAPDETFAQNYFVGGSVGLTDATFNIFKNAHNVGGLVRYSKGQFNVGYSSFTSAVWDSDTSTLKVYHPSVAPWNVKDRFSISVTGYGIDAKLTSAGADYIAIQFFKNGALVTEPDGTCQVCANRFMNTILMNANDVASANGNFWVIGIMEV